MAYEHLSDPHRKLVSQTSSRRQDGASVFAPTLPLVRRGFGFERPPPDDWGAGHRGYRQRRLEQWAAVASEFRTEAFPLFRASPYLVDRHGDVE